MQEKEPIPVQMPFPEPLGPSEPKQKSPAETLPSTKNIPLQSDKSIFPPDEAERVSARNREQQWWWN